MSHACQLAQLQQLMHSSTRVTRQPLHDRRPLSGHDQDNMRSTCVVLRSIKHSTRGPAGLPRTLKWAVMHLLHATAGWTNGGSWFKPGGVLTRSLSTSGVSASAIS